MKLRTIKFGACLLPFSLKCFVCSSTSYYCETWPLILKEEHRLRLVVNRVLRRLFGRKMG